MAKSQLIHLPISLLFLTIQALHTRPPQDSSTPNNTPHQKFGFVPIVGLSFGYGVSVDFIPLSNPFLTDQDSETNYMMLGLYTSATVLVESCQGFSNYDCNKYSCLDMGANTSASMPYFNFQDSKAVRANVYLDYVSWNLNAPAVLATDCIDGMGDSYGTGTYGIVGMGYQNPYNFRGIQHVFSIYLHQKDNNGELIFSKDLTKAQDQTPEVTLSPDQQWETKNVTGVKIGSTTYQSQMTLIFDINADATGFPLAIYQDILEALAEIEPPLNCGQSNYYKPICSYTGDLEELSTIYIVIGGQELALPPEIYAQQGPGEGEIILNLRGLAHNLTVESYVRQNYASYIILDSNVMKYYYTVFSISIYNGAVSTIELYKAAPQVVQDESDSNVVYYVIGGVVTLVIMATLGVIIVRKRMNRKVENGPLLLEGIENQVSLIQEEKNPKGETTQVNATNLAEMNKSQSSSHSSDYIDEYRLPDGELVSRDPLHKKEDQKKLITDRMLRSDENQDESRDDTVQNVLEGLNCTSNDASYRILND